MNAIWTAQFNSSFPNRPAFLSLYLALRGEGDTHSVAAETVRGEILLAAMIR